MGIGTTLLIAFVFMIIGVPIAFAIGGSSLLYYLAHGKSFLLVPQAMVGSVDSFPLLAIPLFMLVGLVMNISGVTKRIFNFASSVVGHIPGGLGHVNVLASIIFAGMSGSATADAAGLGAIEIKAMEEEGFDTAFSGAVTAASSTIGPIIPPSMPMVIYGTTVGVSVGRLFLGGFIPGLLMGLALMILVYIYAVKRNYPKRHRSSLKNLITSFIDAIPSLLTPIILLGGITLGIFTPTEAAGIAAIYSFILGGVFYRELRLKDIVDMCVDVAVTTGTTLLILATAYLFMWILTVNRVPETILTFIQNLNLNRAAFLFVINIFLLLLGTMMTIAPAVVLFAPLLMPTVIALGIDPVHFGVIFVLNLMIGLLTPPVGPVLFIIASITHESVEKVTKACFPFIIPLVIVLLIITYIPETVLWLPNLFMGKNY